MKGDAAMLSLNKNLSIVITVSAFLTILALVTEGHCHAALNKATPATTLFHKGGTGDCEGCHVMHNTEGEWEDNNVGGIPTKNAHRLKGSDPSSTCLNCHQSAINNPVTEQYHISTNSVKMGQGIPPGQLSPGGDFGWLKKNYSWGNNERSFGERHGHNIVAADFNYAADTTIMNAPGGAYPSSGLSCISCHDPHGNYRRLMDGTIAREGLPVVASGSYTDSPEPDQKGAVSTYRMLAGKGYSPSGARQFTSDPPAAVAPVSYNRSESGSDTRVAYGGGMSEWCANCHAGIHNDGNSGVRRHPAGNNAKLSAETVTNYNAYIASGNLNGNSSTAYTSMVPFEMGTNDHTKLKMTANSIGSERNGPSRDANVMCLTCHRAHASGWDSMTRWNMQSEFIVYNGRYPGIDNGAPEGVSQGRTAMEVQKAFYDRPARLYASYQRSLCNKCHAKD
jgi:hypothetical protein